MKAELILILTAIGILLTAGLVFLFKFLVRRESERRVEAYLQDFAGKHYAEVENVYRDMRIWRHDYHNQLQTMMACLELKEFGKLEQHLNELDSDLEKGRYHSQNGQRDGGRDFKQQALDGEKEEYTHQRDGKCSEGA